MRGFIFTLDAIIAFGIILMIVGGLSFFRTEIVSPYLAAQRLHSLSEDMLNVLSSSRARDIVPQDMLDMYLASGILNETDLDKSTIDVIGALWSAGKSEEAENITKGAIGDFIPDYVGYQLLLNSENIYNTSGTSRPGMQNSDLMISSGIVVSGYEKYRPTQGYISRAIATSVKKNTTMVLMGDVITSSLKSLSGNKNANEPNISYAFFIPEDAEIIDAYWFIEAAWADNKFKAYLNGDYIPGSDATGVKLLEDLESLIVHGNNVGNVVYRWGAGGDTGGDDGATNIVVVYNTSLVSTLNAPEKFYFQSVKSECSIQYKKPIFVIGQVYNMSVHMNYSNTPVENSTLRFMWNGNITTVSKKSVVGGEVEWSDSEIRSTLNSIGVSYSELNSRYFWFIVEVDDYNVLEELGDLREINGDDSYIYVNYSRNEAVYNYIDITRKIENYTFADFDAYGFYRYVRWNFDLTHKIPLMARWQLAWLYNDLTDPMQLARANDIVLYNHTPSDISSDPLIVEFARFGYTTEPEGVQIAGPNKFELNFSNGYSIKPERSFGEITFLIPASVGYGDVFVNETDAIEDAEARLAEVLGEDVEAVDIRFDSVSVAGVPYMWGPFSARISVWL